MVINTITGGVKYIIAPEPEIDEINYATNVQRTSVTDEAGTTTYSYWIYVTSVKTNSSVFNLPDTITKTYNSTVGDVDCFVTLQTSTNISAPNATTVYFPKYWHETAYFNTKWLPGVGYTTVNITATPQQFPNDSSSLVIFMPQNTKKINIPSGGLTNLFGSKLKIAFCDLITPFDLSEDINAIYSNAYSLGYVAYSASAQPYFTYLNTVKRLTLVFNNLTVIRSPGANPYFAYSSNFDIVIKQSEAVVQLDVGTTMTGITKNSPFYNSSNYKIFVPDSLLDDYKVADVWSLISDHIYPISEYDGTYDIGD